MPAACNMKYFQDEVRRGKKKGQEIDQAVAVAYSQLKRACGVKSKEKMTPSQIIKHGKKEDVDCDGIPLTESGMQVGEEFEFDPILAREIAESLKRQKLCEDVSADEMIPLEEAALAGDQVVRAKKILDHAYKDVANLHVYLAKERKFGNAPVDRGVLDQLSGILDQLMAVEASLGLKGMGPEGHI